MEYWFVFQNNHMLFINDDTQLKKLGQSVLEELKPYFIRQHSMGMINDVQCFCAEISPDQQFERIEPVSLRSAFEILGTPWYPAIAKAAAIINWDRNHQFCGYCGQATHHKPHTVERVCKACGLYFYPRISPSMIVLITKGDEILLSRSPHFKAGAYGLIAGFLEAGENIEDAIHREVMEEVGLQVNNLRYFGSQAWPFPDSLMIGFIADYAGGEIQIDNKEIIEAGWYHYNNLPGSPSSVSIARKLINHYIEERRPK